MVVISGSTLSPTAKTIAKNVACNNISKASEIMIISVILIVI